LVLIPNQDGDGSPQGFTVHNPGENFTLIRFLTGGGDLALAGATAIQFALDLVLGNFEAGRAPVNDHPNPSPMGFPEGGDPEKLSEGVAHSLEKWPGFLSYQFCSIKLGDSSQCGMRAIDVGSEPKISPRNN
jgi:hypothetical protein